MEDVGSDERLISAVSVAFVIMHLRLRSHTIVRHPRREKITH